ncbi:permease-like cell division protein FtsX [Enterococcus asini]|uniref:Cell division protein FtsX n=2 Tax=Enterococcus asini TaxID=57732 RepID=R2SFQ1_9ENTE|nr:permease-like cell division protein FtsX [Enterococcus asini]EOH86979.1 efflux ABC transporter permease [Enterococcus asini ATCC 700915]EOT58098.1 efflux ABC transporter permease [Enterococcus asini ATCC 700915]MCD5028301.1 ABC transporter permease [Enterococcus asini]MDT2743840.1 permease-like cell division protein FtsX [Enterococcus asini]MDT2762828.1 permease-like cell division protein FtsX [Enterococcus asini]
MIRTFFRHLLESIKSLKRNGWMTVASVSAVTITLSLVGVFMAVIINATKLAEDIESNVDVSVFIEYGTKQPEIDALEKELKGLDDVKGVKFSSADAELEKIKKSMGPKWDLFDEDSNPLYDVFVVSTTDPKQTKHVAKEAGELENVYKADYGGLESEKIFKISEVVKTWGLAAAALLLFVAMFLISNTIRITIISRQREIQIMRLVGAKNGYIRWPFFLEGGWIGLIGSLIPVALMVFGYQKVYEILNPILLRSNYSMVKPGDFSLQISLVLVAVGFVIGSLGSVLSMRRFLKA